MTHSRPTVRRVISEVGELELADEPEKPLLEDALDDLELDSELVEEDDRVEDNDEPLELELLAELELELHPH